MERSFGQEKELFDLDKIERIEITRSFSRKKQLEQYEPIEKFASATAVLKPGLSEQEIRSVSKSLEEFVTQEVERDIAKYENLNKIPF